MNRGIPPNTMIKSKEMQNNNIHYRKPIEYIQSIENKSKAGCNSSLSHNAKKRKINIIRSCNIVKKF